MKFEDESYRKAQVGGVKKVGFDNDIHHSKLGFCEGFVLGKQTGISFDTR